MSDMTHTTILYRPVGRKEMNLIRGLEFRAFPPRLSWQPIFYPVLTEEYAIKIARDWNTKDAASAYVGYVTRFAVNSDFLAKYTVETVGGSECQKYWLPAEELGEFNANIADTIDVVAEFAPSSRNSSD